MKTALNTRQHRLAQRTAFHEAGHAVAAVVLDLPFKIVTVAPPDEKTAGYLHSYRRGANAEQLEHPSPRVRDRVERQIVMTLAGGEAERFVSGRYNHIGAGRIRVARNRYMAAPQGDVAHALQRLELLAGSPRQLDAYHRWLLVRAQELVALWQPAITSVADSLLQRETLTEGDVRQIIRRAAGTK